MADQPPELVEKLADAPTGAVWKARQADGREVLAFQTLLTDDPARQAALDRLRRLARISSHRLAPIRGWWADTVGVWVVGDLEQGVSIPDLPGGGFLSPQQAAAISFGMLGGLEALHAEGLSHGALGPGNVRVMPDGGVVLSGHQLSTLRFPNQEELVAEVREAGRVVCRTFGISPERDPRAAPRAIEHAAPALVVTARSMAAGAMGADVKAAISALRETSGPLGGAERLALGAGELSALVATKRGGSAPAGVPFRSLNAPIGSAGSAPPRAPEPPPREQAPARPVYPTGITPMPPAVAASPARAAPAAAPTLPRRSWEERTVKAVPTDYGDTREGPNLLLIGGIAIVVLLLGLGAWFGRGILLGSGGGSGSGATPVTTPRGGSGGVKATPTPSSRASTPTASPSAIPGQVPVFAPASAGLVKVVTLTPAAGCSPGASCTFNVVIDLNSPGTSNDVTWKFKTVDLCSGAITDFGGGTITPVNGPWTKTDGNTTLSLPPAKGQLAVVALSGPDVAASTPATLGTAGGC
jgi:hypothetical protein